MPKAINKKITFSQRPLARRRQHRQTLLTVFSCPRTYSRCFLFNSKVPEDSKPNIMFHFNNISLNSESRYFIFIGEIKAYGLNRFVGQALNREFGADFQPISLAPDLVDYSAFENLAVINPKASQMAENEKRPVAFRTPMAEFSKTLSNVPEVLELLEALKKNQDIIFIWMFESRPELDLVNMNGVRLLGPDASLINGLNDKTWQYQALGKVVPVVDHAICENRDNLLKALDSFEASSPHGLFVSSSHSAGGAQSMVAKTATQAAERFTDPDGRYLVSRYLPHKYDPTVLAVAGGENEVMVAGVADMNIVDGNKFRGSTFPSVLPPKIQAELREHTAAVGRELTRLGFRGIFGCDYIVTEQGEIFFIEVNPRKQGTTMEFCCTLSHQLPKSAPNLFDLECHAVLHDEFPEDMVQPDYDLALEGGIHWGTFNHKEEIDVVTSHGLPQKIDEGELFARIAGGGPDGHVILEHVGGNVLTKGMTFLGRTVAVGASREGMLEQLAQGKKELRDSIKK